MLEISKEAFELSAYPEISLSSTPPPPKKNPMKSSGRTEKLAFYLQQFGIKINIVLSLSLESFHDLKQLLMLKHKKKRKHQAMGVWISS